MKTIQKALNLPGHEYSGVLGNCMHCNRQIQYSVLQLEQMHGWNKILAARNEELFTPGNFQPCDQCYKRVSEAADARRKADDRFFHDVGRQIREGLTENGVQNLREGCSPEFNERNLKAWEAAVKYAVDYPKAQEEKEKRKRK